MRRATENGSVLTVDLDWPDGEMCSRVIAFESHHADAEGKCPALTGSGPAPRAWAAPEIAISTGPEPDSAAAALISFAGSLGLSCNLHYSRLIANRFTLDSVGCWCLHRIDVFAVTGRAKLLSGRFMPVGWSGRGDGTERLSGGGAREHLAWIARVATAASPTENGAFPVVLAPQAAALLVHETVGHFAEASADPELNLSHRLGCRLATDGFDVKDYPLFDGAVQYETDDEGMAPMAPTPILVDGVLASQLHTRRTAAAANCLPTANARCAQIGLPPIPRMSNLVVPAGSQDLDELVEDLGEGLLVHHLSHGFSRGLDIEARIVVAEEVACGRTTGRFVSGGRVKERIDLLTRCVACANKAELNPNSLCGKAGQILYDVGTISPALRLSKLMVSA